MCILLQFIDKVGDFPGIISSFLYLVDMVNFDNAFIIRAYRPYWLNSRKYLKNFIFAPKYMEVINWYQSRNAQILKLAFIHSSTYVGDKELSVNMIGQCCKYLIELKC